MKPSKPTWTAECLHFLVCISFLPCNSAIASELNTKRIDEAIRAELRKLDVPSASVAVVTDGKISYSAAIGRAQIAPNRLATTSARYEIGSNSKEFLAAAIVMLQDEGKLTLDDKVGKFLPDMGPSSEVTLRQLLSHTAGIRDFWPQDYVFTQMLSPITRDELLNQWARQPLDFQPGERWQYSNTGYVLAGTVLEKVSGEDLFSFLQRRILTPLAITSGIDLDKENLASSDAVGYSKQALGPLRPAVREGKGWLFAAGELALTAEDLARWDISLIDRKLLSPTGYRALESEVILSNGVGSRYALGLDVEMKAERRMLAHDGGTSGFISRNVIFPDQRVAIVVLTNSDAADAATPIADDITRIIFEQITPVDKARLDEARRIFDGLRKGKFDRDLLSSNANDYYTPAAIREISRSIAGLGKIKTFELKKSGTRGGMDYRIYDVDLERKTLQIVTRSLPNGKIEQYMIMPR